MSQRPRTSENLAQRLVRRLGWAVRGTWPDRSVRRHVQGVDMWLPWSHRLPDYARLAPSYGQNLVELAALLAVDGTPLTVVDVGANIGDSTLQILNATESRVLCVEADGFFLDYLHRNVGDDPRVTIEASLLEPGDSVDAVQKAPVRVGGTTRFEPGTSSETAPTVSTSELRRRHPDLDQLRLVKSDTDGYDVVLVPALARAWSESSPVLFFEYDHVLSRVAGNHPILVWDELAKLGYSEVAVWDFSGQPLGRMAVDDISVAARVLDGTPAGRSHDYWDVAVAHRDDEAALAALRKLVPGRLI